MHLDTIDFIIIAAFFALSLGISLYYKNQASKSLDDFFLGGRNLPWYIAGISMVATTFAADTPLAVTEIVSQNGIAGNWLWWNAVAGGMLTTFFFAKLWRKANVLTEVELIEFRYSGKAAAYLRGFKAIYLGLIMNIMIIGWVNLALMTLLEVFFEIPPSESLWYTFGAMAFVALYSSLAGLKGIAITDSIQFFIAMIGCIILAVLVLNSEEIGGMNGLKEKLPSKDILNFFPSIGDDSDGLFSISLKSFIVFIGIQWWASWYPGAEPGGGGYVAQRFMSTKNEKHAIWSTLFFYVAHFCLRPWPWIIVALCAMVLYPELPANEARYGYVMVMRDFLPIGLKGLLLTAFFAAYMSTISTQLNWGASYLVNDFYDRFIQSESSQKNLIKASRVATILLMFTGGLITTQLNSIKEVWEFIFQCGAGLGLVLILRWYWWRINAWSEITAMLVPFACYSYFHYLKLDFPDSYLYTVGITTIAWLFVTFITQPESKETLSKFYDRVNPGGFWPVEYKEGQEKSALPFLFLCWFIAVIFIYSFLFFIGEAIFQHSDGMLIYGVIASISGVILIYGMKKAAIFEE